MLSGCTVYTAAMQIPYPNHLPSFFLLAPNKSWAWTGIKNHNTTCHFSMSGGKNWRIFEVLCLAWGFIATITTIIITGVSSNAFEFHPLPQSLYQGRICETWVTLFMILLIILWIICIWKSPRLPVSQLSLFLLSFSNFEHTLSLFSTNFPWTWWFCHFWHRLWCVLNTP